MIMECMRCGGTAMATGKKWSYNNFDVESFYCEKCKKQTFTYSKEGKVRFTIPKKRQ